MVGKAGKKEKQKSETLRKTGEDFIGEDENETAKRK
jgi:hypothetical protein